MSSPCDPLRQRLDLEAGELRPLSADLEAHVASCPACAAHGARVRALSEVLGSLPRLAVPAELEDRVAFAGDALACGVRAGAHLAALERLPVPDALDGLVVAALEAGSRQDRAVRGLEQLPTLGAPPVLDRLARDLVPDSRAAARRQPAPVDLEQRVARDLIRLPRAEVRRAASRQGRRAGAAPGPRIAGRSAGGRGRRPILLGAAWASLAALLLIWFQAPGQVPTAPGDPATISRAGGPERDLPPLARGLADGLTGGLWSVERAAAAGAAARRALDPDPDPRTPPALTEPHSRRTPAQAPTSGRSPATPGAQGAGGTQGIGPGPHPPGAAAASTFLGRLAASGSGLAYRIVRRVELHLEPGSQPSLVYREEVLSDGAGRFAVDPLAVLPPVQSGFDSELFLTLQKGREGFVLRHRDFRVRDEVEFVANYDVTVMDPDALLLGRPCVELDIRRSHGAQRSYRVWVDAATDLVLAYEEFDEHGILLARVAAESFELDPDLEGVPLSGDQTLFEPLDLDQPGSHPFPLSPPVAVPPGFELAEVATIEFAGEDWVRYLYGDGLEQVFLLIGAPARASGYHSTSGAGAGPAVAAAAHLWYFQVGAWSVLQGDVSGRQVAAMGKIHRADLELLLQSAVETP